MVVTCISLVSIVAILKSVMCTCPERQMLICNLICFNFAWQAALNQKLKLKYSMERSFQEKNILLGELIENISACRLLTDGSCYIKYPLIYPLGSKKTRSSPGSNLMMTVLSLPKFGGGGRELNFSHRKNSTMFLEKKKNPWYFWLSSYLPFGVPRY